MFKRQNILFLTLLTSTLLVSPCWSSKTPKSGDMSEELVYRSSAQKLPSDSRLPYDPEKSAFSRVPQTQDEAEELRSGASALLELEQYDEALKLFELSSQYPGWTDKDKVHLYGLLSKCCAEIGEIGKSISFIEESLKLDISKGDKRLLMCTLADTYAANGQISLAVSTLKKVVDYGEPTADEKLRAHTRLEQYYQSLPQDVAGKISNLQALIPLLNTPSEQYNMIIPLGSLLIDQCREDEAISTFEAALSLDIPDIFKASLYAGLGDAYGKQHKGKESIKNLKKALDIYESYERNKGKVDNPLEQSLPKLLAHTRLVIGSKYLWSTQYTEALTYVNKSLEGPTEGHYFPEEIETAYSFLYEIYSSQSSPHYNPELSEKYKKLTTANAPRKVAKSSPSATIGSSSEIEGKKPLTPEELFNAELVELRTGSFLQSDHTEEAERGIKILKQKLGAKLEEGQHERVYAIYAEACAKLSNYYVLRKKYKEAVKLLAPFKEKTSADAHTKKCKANLEKAEKNLPQKSKKQTQKKKGKGEKKPAPTKGKKKSNQGKSQNKVEAAGEAPSLKGKEPATSSEEEADSSDSPTKSPSGLKRAVEEAKAKARQAKHAASTSPEILAEKVVDETKEFARLQAARLLNWKEKVAQGRLVSQSRQLVEQGAEESSPGRPKLGRTLSSSHLKDVTFTVSSASEAVDRQLAHLRDTNNTTKEAKRFREIERQLATDPFVGVGKSHPLEGNRKGQHARYLNKKLRLIYKVEGTEVTIIEISDYHRG